MTTELNLEQQITLLRSQGYCNAEIFNILLNGGYAEDRISRGLGAK